MVCSLILKVTATAILGQKKLGEIAFNLSLVSVFTRFEHMLYSGGFSSNM